MIEMISDACHDVIVFYLIDIATIKIIFPQL